MIDRHMHGEAGHPEDCYYDPFVVDRTFVLSLFHGFCTSVPKAMRRKLARTETDALQYIMVLRPRVSSFSHRSAFSIRHPAVSMAAWGYYNALRAATQRDSHVPQGNVEGRATSFVGGNSGQEKSSGLSSAPLPPDIKPITLEQLSRNEWAILESCHDSLLQASFPRSIAMDSISTNGAVNNIICRYWERMTVAPTDARLGGEFNDVDGSLMDTYAFNSSSPPQHSTRMTAAQYIYLQLRIVGVLLPPGSLQAEILDSILHDLDKDAKQSQQKLGFSMTNAPQLYGFRAGSEIKTQRGSFSTRKSDSISDLRSVEAVNTLDSLSIKGVPVSKASDVFGTLPDINFGQFWNSMLELSDNWTSSTHPAEHALFLSELYCEVFAYEWNDEDMLLMSTLRATASERLTQRSEEISSATEVSSNAELLNEFQNMMKSVVEFKGSGSLYRPKIPVIRNAPPSSSETHTDDMSDTDSSSGSSLHGHKTKKSAKQKNGVQGSKMKGSKGSSTGSESMSSSFSTTDSDSITGSHHRGGRRRKIINGMFTQSAGGRGRLKLHGEEGLLHRRRSRGDIRSELRRRHGNDDADGDDDGSDTDDQRHRHRHRHRRGSGSGAGKRHRRRHILGDSFSSSGSGTTPYSGYKIRTTDLRSSIDSNNLYTPRDSQTKQRRRHRHHRDKRGKGDEDYGSEFSDGDSVSDVDGYSRGHQHGKAKHRRRYRRSPLRWSESSGETSWSSEESEVYSVPDDQLTPLSLARRNEVRMQRRERREARRERRERRRERRERRRERRGRRHRRKGHGQEMSDSSSDFSHPRFSAAEMEERRARIHEALRAKGINIPADFLSDEDILNIDGENIDAEMLQRLMQGAGCALDDWKESDFLHILLGGQETKPVASASPEVTDSVFAALRTQAMRRPPETEYARRKREEQERLLRKQEKAEGKRHRHRKQYEEPVAPPNTPVDMGELLSEIPIPAAPVLPKSKACPPVVQFPFEDSESELELFTGLRASGLPHKMPYPPRRPVPENNRAPETAFVPRIYIPSLSEVTDIHEHSPERLEMFYRNIQMDRPIKGRAPLVQATSTAGGTYHQLPLIRSRYQPHPPSEGLMSPQTPPPRFVPVKLFSLTTKKTFKEALRESLERYIEDKSYLDTFYSDHSK